MPPRRPPALRPHLTADETTNETPNETAVETPNETAVETPNETTHPRAGTTSPRHTAPVQMIPQRWIACLEAAGRISSGATATIGEATDSSGMDAGIAGIADGDVEVAEVVVVVAAAIDGRTTVRVARQE